MNASSPPSKRIKLDPSPPSPSESDKDPTYTEDLEQEHCTICLQPFLDRAIIPVCAHEFCFDCILLWSEQSRKCPLCSRSYHDAYLIHHIRSQYDYQKYYLPPPPSSPPPPRATALRNARRERQWGRRQRQQREAADQLERAIARRRWIYQHHLYAKHVASNPFTRYRPFPTPAQFAASPDLVSRMTTFLRRELHVWPNLDVEFLTTYTISLMKAIDIRSESAVKLLSEFLDLDTPYAAGVRQINAEHFAHEIYCYLRSPYRDLNMYDQMAQYDTPPDISPPREIEQGSRWSVERSPSHRSYSRLNSRHPSPAPCRKNADRDRDSSAEGGCEDRPNYRHAPNRSPRGLEHDSRNHSGGRHCPPGGVHLRDGHSSGISCAEDPSSAENKHDNFLVHLRSQDEAVKVNDRTTEVTEDVVTATDIPDSSMPQGDDSSTVLAGKEPTMALVDGSSNGANYVDKVGTGGSSANPLLSRKHSAGSTRSSVHVRPCNRTLSESVQAYLARPIVPWHPSKKTKADEKLGSADVRPRMLLQPTDASIGKLASPKTMDGPCMPDDDKVFERISNGHVEYRSGNGATTAQLGCVNEEKTVGVFSTPADVPSKLEDEQAGERGRGRGQMNVDTLPLQAPSLVVAIAVDSGDPCSSYRSSRGNSRAASPPLSRSDPGPDVRSGSGSLPTWASAPNLNLERPNDNDVGVERDADADMSTLEKRLRARARVRVRLAAIKGTVSGGGGGVRDVSSLG